MTLLAAVAGGAAAAGGWERAAGPKKGRWPVRAVSGGGVGGAKKGQRAAILVRLRLAVDACWEQHLQGCGGVCSKLLILKSERWQSG
jgi:hypothetical protein